MDDKRARVDEDDLDPDQRRVVDAVRSGRNVFFTGPAGTGKSHTIKKIAGTDPSVGLTALTGVAALNIGGKTIHSFAGVGYAQESAEELVAKMSGIPRERIKRCRLLVVDEVSMKSAELLEKLDYVFRHVRKILNKPFGGVQLVFVGDFYQICPVSTDADVKYCFESPLWAEMNFVHILLKINHRQVDPVLVRGLALMRVGVLDEEFRKAITEPKVREGPIKPTKLVGTNAEVDRINARELAALTGEKIVFESKDHEYVRNTLQHLRGDKKLTLAVGAQVIHLWNNGSLVNGSRGVVTEFSEGIPIVQFMGISSPLPVPLHTFESREQGRLLCSRTCIPLRLAFCITIHKSQSQTIDLIDVDCKGMFTASQAYVAVSRARTMEGLFVKNLDPGCVWVDPRVEAFYRGFTEDS